MSKGGASAPRPPDPVALTEAQAEANRLTQFSPLGDLRFGEVGEQGQFVPGTSGAASFIDLSPDTQQALDLQQQVARILGGRAVEQTGFLPAEPVSLEGLPQFSSEIDLSGLQGLPGLGDFSGDAQRVEDATFQRALGLLNPQFERREDRLRQTLANQGLPTGGEAFAGEFEEFNRLRNEAEMAAAFDAVGAGRAEQSRLFGLGSAARAQGLGELLQQEDLARGARQQELSERFGTRANVFNELASLLGTAQVQTPQFGQAAPIDVLGAQGLNQQGQLAAFNADQQQQLGLQSGLFGLGTAGLLGFGSGAFG